MPDYNCQWKARLFFLKGVNWVCHPDKWNSIGSFYDHSWGFLNKSGESLGLSGSSVCTFYLTNVVSLFVSTTVFLMILLEQEAVLERVFEIPFEGGPRRSSSIWTHFTPSMVDPSLLRKPDD